MQQASQAVKYSRPQLQKMTVPQLKDQCRLQRLQLGGLKEDLVNRLQSNFEQMQTEPLAAGRIAS